MREYRAKRRKLNNSAAILPPTRRQMAKLAEILPPKFAEVVLAHCEELREWGERMVRFAFRPRFGADARRELAFFVRRHLVTLKALPHDWFQAECSAAIAEKLLRWEVRGKLLVADVEWREAKVAYRGSGAGPLKPNKTTAHVLTPLPGIEEPANPSNTLPGYHMRKARKEIVRR